MESILPTTLLLLFFVTAPANVPKDLPKPALEAQSVWVLQSTARIDLKSPQACKDIGTAMLEDIRPVTTMTVRAYCICENGNGKQCPNDTLHSIMSMSQGQDMRALNKVTDDSKATLQPLGYRNNQQREPRSPRR